MDKSCGRLHCIEWRKEKLFFTNPIKAISFTKLSQENLEEDLQNVTEEIHPRRGRLLYSDSFIRQTCLPYYSHNSPSVSSKSSTSWGLDPIQDQFWVEQYIFGHFFRSICLQLGVRRTIYVRISWFGLAKVQVSRTFKPPYSWDFWQICKCVKMNMQQNWIRRPAVY